MQRILILGATSPIARKLALLFAAGGARLFLAARNMDEASRIAADLEVRQGVRPATGHFEASEPETHADFLDRACAELGGLDGVLLCFGALGNEELASTSVGEALKIVTQNFTGAVSILTLAAERLRIQGSGFVIVIGSVAGERGRRANYVYGSAKGALALFTQGVRSRLARAGVHVMTVKLGLVDTRMTWSGRNSAFTVSPTRAAGAIHAAWRRRAEVVYVPWLWRPLMFAVRLIPERVFKQLKF